MKHDQYNSHCCQKEIHKTYLQFVSFSGFLVDIDSGSVLCLSHNFFLKFLYFLLFLDSILLICFSLLFEVSLSLEEQGTFEELRIVSLVVIVFQERFQSLVLFLETLLPILLPPLFLLVLLRHLTLSSFPSFQPCVIRLFLLLHQLLHLTLFTSIITIFRTTTGAPIITTTSALWRIFISLRTASSRTRRVRRASWRRGITLRRRARAGPTPTGFSEMFDCCKARLPMSYFALGDSLLRDLLEDLPLLRLRDRWRRFRDSSWKKEGVRKVKYCNG